MRIFFDREGNYAGAGINPIGAWIAGSWLLWPLWLLLGLIVLPFWATYRIATGDLHPWVKLLVIAALWGAIVAAAH